MVPDFNAFFYDGDNDGHFNTIGDNNAAIAINASSLTKIYHDNVAAVDNITFSVNQGEIFGLLGPNGAGKTTTIRMIVTLSKPTAGKLEVFGVDVVKSPEIVRGMLGYVPQSISVDADLTAFENLLIFSKLSYVSKNEREEKIHKALQSMDLAERSNDLVKHYSGGMMRRLEIAQALVNRPRILILDEPSIGLDPSSKRQVWSSIKQLRKEYDTTILITTHDMNEADALCNRLAIMSAGKISALGEPAELKRTVGGDVVTVTLDSMIPDINNNNNNDSNIKFPSNIGTVVSSDDTSIQVLTGNGEEAIPFIMDFFRGLGIRIESISISKPNLDDVFMKYAKRRLTNEISTDSSSGRRNFVRRTK
jgi:ABC-2 type transport system ATP-binding protein